MGMQQIPAPQSTRTEIKSLASDVALDVTSIGNRVVVSGQANAYRAIRTPSEAALLSGYEVNQITNGDTTSACLVFSSDWKCLHAKVNAGGSLKMGFLSSGSYAYYDKSSLAAVDHFDRSDLMTYLTTITGWGSYSNYGGAPCPIVQVDTNLFVFAGIISNVVYAVAVQYDTTAGVWRHSTRQTIGGVTNYGNGFFVDLCVVDTTHAIATVRSSGQTVSDDVYQNEGVWATRLTITPGTSPSDPTLTVGTSNGIGHSRHGTTTANTVTNFAPAYTYGIKTAYHSGVLTIALTSYAISGSGTYSHPVDTGSNYRSGVARCTVSGDTITFSAVSAWVTGVNRILANTMGIFTIPGETKQVVVGKDASNSNKMRAVVHSAGTYGTTVDVSSYTHSTVDFVHTVVCPSSTKAVVTYKTDTDSTNVSGSKRTAAKSLSITASTNTITADGTEIDLMSGQYVSRVVPKVFDTTSMAMVFNYTDKVVKSTGVTASSINTFTLSGTTLSVRSTQAPRDYMRPAGTFDAVFPIDLAANPKILAFMGNSYTVAGFFPVRITEADGYVNQFSDGSPFGGYARTA